MSSTRNLIEEIESMLTETAPDDLELVLEPRLLGPIQDTKFLQHRLVHVFRERTTNLRETRSAMEDRVEDAVVVELAYRPDSDDQKVGRGEAWDLEDRIINRVTDRLALTAEDRLEYFDSADRVVGEFFVIRTRFRARRFRRTASG
jgi:hypothetical protein